MGFYGGAQQVIPHCHPIKFVGTLFALLVLLAITTTHPDGREALCLETGVAIRRRNAPMTYVLKPNLDAEFTKSRHFKM